MRIGKIARLPHLVREEINRRLQAGQEGGKLLPWLNEIPVVKSRLAEMFGGRAVTKQNLSEWRRGGYEDWLLRQNAAEVVRSFQENAEEMGVVSGDERLTEKMGVWVAAHYMMALEPALNKKKYGEAEVLKRLSRLCRDVVMLRRSDHHQEMLKIEHERNLLRREKGEKLSPRAEEEALLKMVVGLTSGESATMKGVKTSQGQSRSDAI